jgi:hypothetical protein
MLYVKENVDARYGHKNAQAFEDMKTWVFRYHNLF